MFISRVRHIWGLLAFAAAFGPLYGQQERNYSFTSFGAAQGLASSEIISLYQDHNRFIWIGHTAGISRWDGYSFKNYLWAGQKRIGKTYNIRQDHQQRIWVCAEGGLFALADDQVRQIAVGNEHMPVYDVLFLRDTVWLGTIRGPAQYSISQWQKGSSECKLPLQIIPSWKNTFPHGNEARQIERAKDGSIFISDVYSLYIIEQDIHRMIWRHRDEREHVTGLEPWNKDSIYFSTTSSGLQAMEHGNYRIVDSTSGTGNALEWQNDHLLYHATKGLYSFHPASGSIRTILLLPGAYNKWGSSVLADKENTYWIGTHEQLIHAKPDLFHTITLPRVEGFDELFHGIQLRDGNMLIGGNRGRVYKKAPGSKDFQLVLKTFSLAPVAQFHEDADGSIWAGSYYQGIAYIRQNNVQIYTMKEGLRDNTNFFFTVAKDGRLFTGGDAGISQIIRDKETVSFKNFDVRGPAGDYPVFRGGIETNNGSLLFGSNWGLYVLRNDSLKLVAIRGSAINSAITGIQTDKAGNIWISTNGNGILLCRQTQDGIELVRSFTDQDGLNASIYTSLLIDRENVIWAAGYKGLSRIEPRDGQYFIMNLEQRLITAYHTISLVQDKDGLLWIPTSSGLMLIDPAEIRNAITPPVLSWASFYSLKKKKQVMLPGADKSIDFPHDENAFLFSFTGIALSAPAPVHYFYRVRELDTSWTDNGLSRQVSFQNLAPGQYTLEVKAHAGSSAPSNIISVSFNIAPPFWKQWWFLLLSALALSAIVFFAVRRRERAIKARESEKAELQMTALRAQMNPHFIFNALNSVQHYILRGDADEANKYISKFSRLQRLILHHCDQQFISLDKELEMLGLYLQLEKLRVKGNFEYSMDVPEEIDTTEVNIPPMILQPFIENAIWHGLMPKEGDGILKIKLWMEGQLLICVVEDNGIGRKAAAALKEQSSGGTSHHSKGLKLVEERLAILRKQYAQRYEFTISDNEPEGTTVKLVMHTGT